MKPVITALAAICMLSFTILAANSRTLFEEEHGSKYCGKMKEGKFTVMHMGSAITSDVTLDNGTKIQPDGTIIKKDNTKMTLKAGECIDMDGKVVKEDKDKDKGMHKDKGMK